MLKSNLNPYKDVKEMSTLQWMFKNNGKQMLFGFLFISIFTFMPWIGQWYIASAVVRWSITIGTILLNLASTLLYPYLMHKTTVEDYNRWEENNDNGWYK
jgi:hypothetical protein